MILVSLKEQILFLVFSLQRLQCVMKIDHVDSFIVSFFLLDGGWCFSWGYRARRHVTSVIRLRLFLLSDRKIPLRWTVFSLNVFPLQKWKPKGTSLLHMVSGLCLDSQTPTGPVVVAQCRPLVASQVWEPQVVTWVDREEGGADRRDSGILNCSCC